MEILGIMLLSVCGLVFAIMLLVYVGVPVLRAVGDAIAWTIRGIGAVIIHIASFIFGTIRDLARLVGAILATVVFFPLMLGSVLIGRWSAASHYSSSIVREGRVLLGCAYRVLLKRPLRLVLLDGVLEGIEQRVPDAIEGAPGGDSPSRKTGLFDGYRIVGSLRPGGSGAKLYVAEPEAAKRQRHAGMPEMVVIKSFAITDGSTLPQIIRESRALESARQMGLIFDHGLDEHRFFYVMPYHAGENLGVVTRQLHAESAGDGLALRELRRGLKLIGDLVATLAEYHRGGLWHKDVKPENVIVHDGRASLVDLGLVSSLRSAMTLTTHGTEYFRDPEMVRLALRGVKVHQVDGAKFDIFGAGAVLYFLLENTFPAHGALSSFSKRSPEALRWIVRRAMADYNKRYETAEAMLQDIRFALEAPDTFAVRPAELPSMRGGAAEALVFSPPAAIAAASFAAMPFAPAGAAAAALAMPAAGVHQAFGRPILNVKRWWTGQYELGGFHPAPSAVPMGAVQIPAMAGVHTPLPPSPAAVAAAARPAGHAPFLAPAAPFERPSAAVQLASARHRAAQRRERARAHVAHRAARHPARPAVALVLFTLLGIGTILGLTLLKSTVQSVSQSSVGNAATRVPSPSDPRLALPIPSAVVPSAELPRLRLALVNIHPDPINPNVLEEVSAASDRYSTEGYLICEADIATTAELVRLLPKWRSDFNRYDEPLEDLFESTGYYGVLWIDAREGGGPASERTRVTMLRSTREGATGRKGFCVSASDAEPGEPAEPAAPAELEVPVAPVPPLAPAATEGE